MPASVTEDLINFDCSPDSKDAGAALDMIYLIKNISFTNSPIPNQFNVQPWYSETDPSLEASTPRSKVSYDGDNSLFRNRLNGSSLEYKDIDELFDFHGDDTKKILSTPDPAAFRAARKSREIKKFHRDRQCKSTTSLLESDIVDENINGDVQFDLNYFSISDVLQDKPDDNKVSQDTGSIHSSKFDQTDLFGEITPKMTSTYKNHQFGSIVNARTPHARRTLKRKMTSRSIPCYGMMDVTNSPSRLTRMSSDISEGFNRVASRENIPPTKNWQNHTLSEKDTSRRRTEVLSDGYYASYLDYVDVFRSGNASPVNDCPFETSESLNNVNEISKTLDTIPEIELEGRFGCSSKIGVGRDQRKGIKILWDNNSEEKDSSIVLKSFGDFSIVNKIKKISLSDDVLALVANIQLFVHRPMSFRADPLSEKGPFSIASLASAVGCKVLEKVFVPTTVQAILKQELIQAMGNGNSKAITSSKFLPHVGIKKQSPSYALQRKRYGPREVHRNIWRLERKTFGKPVKTVKDPETEEQNSRPEVPKRSTYKKRKAVSKEKEIEVVVKELEVKVPCAAPNPDSLPSRSEVLPPDGDSLRSDAEKKHQSSEGHSRCPSCTSSQLKLSKAYAQKGAVAVTLEKTQRDLNNAHTRIKDLEFELEDCKKNAEDLSATIKDLETEMCQLQKDKALLQQELMVTRKQLTRILDQSDSSDSSHVSSVFVSGSQNLTDDGLGDETTMTPDEDGDGHPDDDDDDDIEVHSRHDCDDVKTRLQPDNFVEMSRLEDMQMKNEELELTIRHCEERIIELEDLLRQATTRNDTRDVTTQTFTRDGTFTRPEKTKIPKRMLGHHSSLPVISDPNNLGRCKTQTGSLTRLENLQRSLRVKEREITTLKKVIATMEMNEVGKELEKHKEKEVMIQNSKIGELTSENRRLLNELQIVKENYQRETVLRKKYFNIAEDLKGKIRVFCRIKPMAMMHRNALVLEVPDEYTVMLRTHRAQYEFTFDGVFDGDRSQEDVFSDVQNLVQSAVDGYNVCIFAYGQTGSGKTYTLVGNESQPGIGPRAFQKIFDLVRENQCELDFRITVSVYELYNERLIDLLKDSTEDNLKIRRDHYGLVFVQGSESREVKNERQLSEIFEEACRNRHVGATRMNTESSRSHLVITIRVESTNKITGTVSRGKLSIIDLAGSERVGKTAAVAQQLKEANSINKSLSALGDVIAALSSEQQHVPYRNNKLTLLMQDSLGGNAKTLMFVNISSSEQNVEESLNSLTYASRVKQITNSASRMAESKEVARLRSIIMKLSKENKSKN